jgi:hypothetical protein
VLFFDEYLEEWPLSKFELLKGGGIQYTQRNPRAKIFSEDF